MYTMDKKDKREGDMNRGHGAGGAGTNKNGLPYEALTDLTTHFTEVTSDKTCKQIHFHQYPDFTYSYCLQAQVLKMMQAKGYLDTAVPMAHGCKRPDECIVDEKNNIVFIIEKKFQEVNGSVCEKIQTGPFKLYHYKRLFPKLKVLYLYCLSDWFKTNCIAELEYLKSENIPVFYGNDEDYKNKLIQFITETSMSHERL